MLHRNPAEDVDKEAYWDSFYSSREIAHLMAPSQFAAFVLQEAASAQRIVEIGCGTGRDSLFFARHGKDVYAIDGSHSAIEACEKVGSAAAITGASFHCAAIGTPSFREAIDRALPDERIGEVFVYARFFLHAITEREEDEMLQVLAAAMRSGDRMAFEYRTVRDASGEKVTASHYRRYVEPSEVFAKARRLGFSVEYAVEGFGFAKYKGDDAYVARCILRKS